MLRVLALLMILPGALAAKGEKPGSFDYYVLALSWSPNWCLREGNAKGSSQCDADADFGWVLHGLWPQFEKGWPSYCPSSFRNPSRSMTKSMVDIMGSSGLAWHQWKKHGVCAGMSPTEYYELSRTAFQQINRPAAFRKLPRAVTLPASLIEDAFLQDNPAIEADGLTVTCKSNAIQEVRICLTKDLEPRVCGRDVMRDCTLQKAEFAPIP